MPGPASASPGTFARRRQAGGRPEAVERSQVSGPKLAAAKRRRGLAFPLCGTGRPPFDGFVLSKSLAADPAQAGPSLTSGHWRLATAVRPVCFVKNLLGRSKPHESRFTIRAHNPRVPSPKPALIPPRRDAVRWIGGAVSVRFAKRHVAAFCALHSPSRSYAGASHGRAGPAPSSAAKPSFDGRASEFRLPTSHFRIASLCG
jgi:hypothetical protein